MGGSLAEELLLIACDEDGRPPGSSIALECGLAGAVLVELVLARRLDIREGRLHLRSASSLRDPELDAALQRIATWDEARAVEWWIGKLRAGIRGRLLEQLAREGLLTVNRRRALGMLPVRAYALRDSAARAHIHDRLRHVMIDEAVPDGRTAALVRLLEVSGVARLVLPDLDRDQLQDRIERVRESEWVTEAVRAVVTSVHALLATSTAGVSAGAPQTRDT